MRLMVELILLVAGVLGAGQAPDGTAIVRGRVVNAVTGKPLRGVTVRFTPPFESNRYRPPKRIATSDAGGSFELTALIAGEYSVSASPAGDYLEARFGQRAAGGGGRSLHVVDQARLDITLGAWPAARLSGRVIDEQGRRVVDARLILVTRHGGTVDSAATDDRGEYEFARLAPGDYAVGVPINLTSRTIKSASPPRAPGAYEPAFQPYLLDRAGRTILTTYGAPLPPPARDGQPSVYITSFYGAGGFGDARYIELVAGQSRGGVDVVLRDRPARRVSGVATTPTGPVPGIVLVLSTDERTPWYVSDQITATASADGSFVFVGVPDGSYRLTAYKRNPPFTEVSFAGAAPMIAQDDYVMGDKDVLHASLPFTVTGDQDGVDVFLQPGTPIGGRIILQDGTTPAFGNQPPRFTLLSTQDGRFSRTAPYIEIAPDGTFSGHARPGSYVLDASGQVRGWSFTAARANGMAVEGRTIEVGDTPVALELTYSRGVTALRGYVSDTRGSLTRDASILVFPTDETTWDADGAANVIRYELPRRVAFDIPGLMTGDYYVVAIDETAGLVSRVPAGLRSLVPLATPVRIEPGEPVTVNLVMRDRPGR
ncbi:MAG TPA: carboxypeptidase-like regulatory domain-containing protein [Vicinamibacterales bacterium]|nr:carboxypeptidase-like regulatory domain-containing protein [Vicinamibacterales bacterium]